MNEPDVNIRETDPLERLKSILLTEDQQRIGELESELRSLVDQLRDRGNLVKTLEPVIAELLQQKIHNSKEEMAQVLAPIMGEAIKRQIQDAREDVVDALYPIMGRMVSKAVAEAMKKIVANINASLNKSFDLQIWKKRIKARVLRIDPGEMILAGAAPFTLQQLFLISRQSGLLISYVSREDRQNSQADAQVIGGMLTAIKGFVETSFAESEEGELQEIQHSDRCIRVESGRHSYLAAVYSGIAPADFDRLLQQCHHTIHRKYHKRLRDYSGDNSPFKGVDVPLRKLFKKINPVLL